MNNAKTRLGTLSKEAELELVALKLRHLQAEAKRKGTKFETLDEVKKRYGFE
ncbi:MAG: hypothetical protein AABX02_00630 [archaeon]